MHLKYLSMKMTHPKSTTAKRIWRLVNAQMSHKFDYCLHALCQLFCNFMNTRDYPLGRYKPSSPSTKELHDSPKTRMRVQMYAVKEWSRLTFKLNHRTLTIGGRIAAQMAVSLARLDSTSGQSYKQFILVIYKSRVVIWGIFKSGTTLEL